MGTMLRVSVAALLMSLCWTASCKKDGAGDDASYAEVDTALFVFAEFVRSYASGHEGRVPVRAACATSAEMADNILFQEIGFEPGPGQEQMHFCYQSDESGQRAGLRVAETQTAERSRCIRLDFSEGEPGDVEATTVENHCSPEG